MSELQSKLDYYIPIGIPKEKLFSDRDIVGVFPWIGSDDDGNGYVDHQKEEVIKLSFDWSKKVESREVLIGPEASEARNLYGNQVSKELKAKIENEFLTGTNLEESLTKLFGPKLLSLGHLDIHFQHSGEQDRRYRLPGGAILDVKIDLNAKIKTYEFITGNDAAEIMKLYRQLGGSSVRKGEVIKVNSWGEALLVVRIDGGTPIFAREKWVGPQIESTILAKREENELEWKFLISERENLSLTYLGEQACSAYGPVHLLLLISQQQLHENDPYFRSVIVSALRKLLSTLPVSAESFPEESLNSAVEKYYYKRSPERLTRSYFEKQIRLFESNDGSEDADNLAPGQELVKEKVESNYSKDEVNSVNSSSYSWNRYLPESGDTWRALKLGAPHQGIALLLSIPTAFGNWTSTATPIMVFGLLSIVALVYTIKRWQPYMEELGDQLAKIEIRDGFIHLPFDSGQIQKLSLDNLHINWGYYFISGRSGSYNYHYPQVWVELKVGDEIRALLMGEEGFPENNKRFFEKAKESKVPKGLKIRTSTRAVTEIVDTLLTITGQ